jgi:GTP-binding protein
VRRAVKEADTVLFVVDSREGLVPEDEHLARWLHKMVRDTHTHTMIRI